MTSFNVSTTAGVESALAGAKAGDVILLAPGTYSGLSISNLNIAGSVTIESQNNANAAILTGMQVSGSSGLNFTGLDVIGSGTGFYASVSSSSNVSFSNMLFEGSNATPTNDAGGLHVSGSTGVSVTNSTFEQLGGGSAGAVVALSSDNNVTFTGNALFNIGGDGMDVAGTSNINISNNSFSDFHYAAGFHPDAIQFWNVGTSSSAQNITISNNLITRGDGQTTQGIFIEDDSSGALPYLGLTITGNTTVGIPYNAIAINGQGATDSTASINPIVTGNTVIAYTDYEAWISVQNSTGATVTNNVSNGYNLTGDTGLTQSGDTTHAAIVAPSPTIANTGTAATYAAGGAAATVANAFSVADLGATVLKSASVAITGGFLAGDALNFANQHGITGAYNASTGVLTLSGYATLANYQAALDSITYSSSASDPTHGGADTARTVTFSANDGAHGSNALAASLSVSGGPPAAPASLSNTGSTPTYQAGGSAQHVAQSLAVTDTAASTLWSANVAITGGFVAGDSLNFANQNGISGSYNGLTGVLSLTGAASLANYQAALDSVTFSSSAADPTHGPPADPTDGAPDPLRAVTFTVNDGFQNSNSAAASVAVVAASTPQPVIANAGSVATYQAGGAAADIAQQLVVADTNSTTLASATVAITGGFVTGDALTFGNQSGITGSYNASAGVLTLTGSASLAAYQAALDSITFSSSAADPTHAPPTDPSDGGPDPLRAVTFTVNDGHSSNSLIADVGVTNPLAAAASVAAPPVTAQAAVASAAMVPITSVTASPVVTASTPPPPVATSPVNIAPTLDTSHLSALAQSLLASNLMHAYAGIGGMTGSIGSGAFIFSAAATQALGLTGGVGALASGATSSDHLGALTPAVQAAVSPAAMGIAGAVGDSLVLHQADFVLPLLGGHSLAGSHPPLLM